MNLTVIRSPSEALALTNCLVLNRDDIVAQLGSARHVLVNKDFILTTMYGLPLPSMRSAACWLICLSRSLPTQPSHPP